MGATQFDDPTEGDASDSMSSGSARYRAVARSGGNWRVWDKDRREWVGDLFPSYPGALLKELNSSSTVHSYHEQALAEYRPRGLVPVAHIAAYGAVLGAYFAPWLLLPGPPLGALAGGLLGLIAGSLFNTWVYGRSSEPKPPASNNLRDDVAYSWTGGLVLACTAVIPATGIRLAMAYC